MLKLQILATTVKMYRKGHKLRTAYKIAVQWQKVNRYIILTGGREQHYKGANIGN